MGHTSQRIKDWHIRQTCPLCQWSPTLLDRRTLEQQYKYATDVSNHTRNHDNQNQMLIEPPLAVPRHNAEICKTERDLEAHDTRHIKGTAAEIRGGVRVYVHFRAEREGETKAVACF
jgi:hypothetical protein